MISEDIRNLAFHKLPHLNFSFFVLLRYTRYSIHNYNITTIFPRYHLTIDGQVVFIKSNYTWIFTTKLSKKIGYSLEKWEKRASWRLQLYKMFGFKRTDILSSVFTQFVFLMLNTKISLYQNSNIYYHNLGFPNVKSHIG